jgi:capsular polysaccharide biosynthesis protein
MVWIRPGIILFLLVKPDFESYTTILVEEQSTINPLIQKSCRYNQRCAEVAEDPGTNTRME